MKKFCLDRGEKEILLKRSNLCAKDVQVLVRENFKAQSRKEPSKFTWQKGI